MTEPDPDRASPPADESDRELVARYRARDREERAAGQMRRMSGVGMEFVFAVVLLGGIGWGLDYLLGTLPWFLVGGVVIGFGLGLWLLIRTGMQSFR